MDYPAFEDAIKGHDIVYVNLAGNLEPMDECAILDYISIYFLKSSTYTPFLLIYTDNTFGITQL